MSAYSEMKAVRLPTKSCALDKPCGLFRKKRSGTAAVEFALVAPVFFLLVIGIVEYGRMVMVQQVIVNASREGARQAVLEGATATEVIETVVSYGMEGAVTIHAADVILAPANLEEADFGDPIQITITIPFDQVSWLPAPMYLAGKNLVATTAMRREAVQ